MTDNIAPSSKADSTNPKDLLGLKKVSMTKLPAVAIVHAAHAMMDGAAKYGPYNWRAKKVVAAIYVDAATRHILSWFEGEELAQDSQVHHLGHAIACLAILLDAQETGNLVDDRPVTAENRAVLTRVLDRLNAQISAAAAKSVAPQPPQAHTKEIRKTITINGIPVHLRCAVLTYAEIVKIAFPHREDRLPSVSYYVRDGYGGVLTPGQFLMADDGLSITAVYTTHA